MNTLRLSQVVLLCFLFCASSVEAKARWQPQRLPTINETARVIKHVLVNYDDGRCKTRAHRRSHPSRCVKVDGDWRQAKLGVWRWHNETFRKEHYTDGKIRWYAQGIINALEKVELGDNFDYYVSMVMEALRQSKFHPRAWSRYNRGADGQYIRFDQPWCDGKNSLLAKLGRVCETEGAKRRCKNAIDLFETGTAVAKKRFHRKCDWADRKGGDGGAFQMHMSTLARIARTASFRRAAQEILGHKEPWHYTMGQHFWISAVAAAHWQKKQGLVLTRPKTEEGCGKWMKKRYTRRQIKKMGKAHPRSATYSCFKLRYCNGTPMKVGNARNACHRARFVRKSFRQVMGKTVEITLADEVM